MICLTNTAQILMSREVETTDLPTSRGTAPSILAAAVVAVLLLLANFSGSPVVGPDILSDGQYGPDFTYAIESMVHGWPLTYLRHEGHYTPSGEGPSPWQIGRNSHFRIWPLVTNIALLVGSAVVVGWLVRRRIQRHGWQFRIVDLMLAVAAVAVVLAFVASRRRMTISLRTCGTTAIPIFTSRSGNRLALTGCAKSRAIDCGDGEIVLCTLGWTTPMKSRNFLASLRSSP